MSVRYRKSGCLPCKRSHKKCDEAKPACSSCVKRNLECDYGSLFVLFNNETGDPKGKSQANPGANQFSNQFSVAPASASKVQIKFEHNNLEDDASLKLKRLAKLKKKREKKEQQQQQQQQPALGQNSRNFKEEQLYSPPNSEHSPFGTDSNTLATNNPPSTTPAIMSRPLYINKSGLSPQLDALHTSMFTDNSVDFDNAFANIDLKYLDSILADEPRSVTPVIPTETVNDASLRFDWDSVTPEDLSKIIELNDPFLKFPNLPMDDIKLETFIKAYFRQSKCSGNYIYNPKPETNLLVDWMELLETQYPILKNVVYVMSSYSISCLRPQDEHWNHIKNVYLKECIGSLISNINTNHPFELVSLLTVVILFYSVDTSTTANAWRKHLSCAFALIQRFDSIFPSKHLVLQMYDPQLTEVAFNLFHFMKDNFLYAESLAWISASGGGILKNKAEIDYLFSRDSYCEPILIDHLVLVKGSSRYVTTVFGKVIRIIFELRDKHNVIISGSNCIFASVPTDEYYEEGLLLMEELTQIEYMELDLSSIEEKKLLATLKYSNKAFILALKLFISITLLKEPIFSKKTQDLSQLIADCVSNMPYAESQSVGIHWPMFMAALCSQPGPLRQVFIKHLTNIVNRGMTVATYTLQRLNLAWKCMANGQYFDESQFDHITF